MTARVTEEHISTRTMVKNLDRLCIMESDVARLQAVRGSQSK